MTIERWTDVPAASSVLVRRRSAMQPDDASPPLAGAKIGSACDTRFVRGIGTCDAAGGQPQPTGIGILGTQVRRVPTRS